MISRKIIYLLVFSHSDSEAKIPWNQLLIYFQWMMAKPDQKLLLLDFGQILPWGYWNYQVLKKLLKKPLVEILYPVPFWWHNLKVRFLSFFGEFFAFFYCVLSTLLIFFLPLLLNFLTYWWILFCHLLLSFFCPFYLSFFFFCPISKNLLSFLAPLLIFTEFSPLFLSF